MRRSDGKDPWPDEKALMRAIEAGDRAAWEALCERHKPYLLKVASTLIKDASRAEDLVQEALLALLETLKKPEPIEKLRPFLRKVIKNQRARLLESLREEATEDGVLLAYLENAQIEKSDHERNLLEQVAREDLIMRALQALPENQRNVLILRYFGGLPFSKIAVLLDMTISNVKVAASRAVKAMKKKLKEK